MPQVTIIIPCYNEQKTIRLLLDALFAQTFPHSQMEVVIADGMSQDSTRSEIAVWQGENPNLLVRVVDNPKRNIPSALNRAIEVARGEFIVRLDAHSVPAVDYVERSVAALENGLGDNVGGIWRIQPGASGWVARSIAIAASHPLAVGGAQYRVGGQPQEVDTVPFGAFRRALVDRIGPYDESLFTNEDYEFNTRIRQADGVVWFDPLIQSAYFARSTYNELASQYWRYGYWKLRMLRRYPETIRWRQGLPPVFVASLILLGALAFLSRWAGWLLLLEGLGYLLVLLAIGIRESQKHKDWPLVIGLPLAIGCMHFSWGMGFIWSFVKVIFKRN